MRILSNIRGKEEMKDPAQAIIDKIYLQLSNVDKRKKKKIYFLSRKENVTTLQMDISFYCREKVINERLLEEKVKILLGEHFSFVHLKIKCSLVPQWHCFGCGKAAIDATKRRFGKKRATIVLRM
jgi:hypothetical protein